MKPVLGRLSVERARHLFSYDPVTGIITRNVLCGGQMPGTVVGGLRKDGYLSVKVDRNEWLCHRLAWLLHYGVEPDFEVDHKNNIRSQNWIDNLRPSGRGHNMQHQKVAHKNNKLGVLGVHQDAYGRFIARIRVNKKPIALGSHDTVEQASAAYLAAKRQLHEGNLL
jgi:hypothetical protein